MSILNYVLENPKILLDLGAYGIAIASIIVKLTPSKVDDEVMEKVLKIVQSLSLMKKE